MRKSKIKIIDISKGYALGKIICLAIIISLIYAFNSQPGLRNAPGDYSSLSYTGNNVEAALHFKQQNDASVNSYMWLICGPDSWEELKIYLSEAKMAGISVFAILLPPYQSSPVCTESQYSEPFGNDYILWAEEIATLSLRYSNLIGYGIDDLQENINLGYLTQSYINSMITAGISINPLLEFIDTYINSKTYWVAITGDDNNTGTYTEPFATIQHAYSLAVAGDSIIVKPGVYNAGDYMGEILIYLTKAGITLKSETRGAAIIDCEDNTDGHHNIALYLRGDNTVIDGFRITGSVTTGIFVNSSYNKIINCEIDSNGIVGETVYGQTGVFERDTVGNNLYARNYVHHNGRQLGAYGDHGFYLEGDSDSLLYNIFAFNASQGVQLSGCSYINVYNNTFVHNGSSGLNMTNHPADSINIRNNIFYQNNGRGFDDNTGYAIKAGTTISRVHISDNLFAEADGCGGTEGCLWNFGFNWGDWSAYADTANVYIHNGPLFVDDSSDFSLAYLNLGVDGAYDWGQTEDYNLAPKYSNEWDIGAIEYRPAVP